MMARTVVRVLSIALVIGCTRETPEPARVLLVTIDTLRADHVGCYGAARAHTPTLDALAQGGVRFDTAISPVPITLPSHTTIFTGLDPDHHGIRHNGVFALPAEIPTLAERMQSRGYATAAFVGAFVLDHRFGLGRGFDFYDDRIGENRSSRGMIGYPARPADAVVDAFLAWLAGAPERFFAWVHVYDPHTEYAPPAGFSIGFAGRPYDGEIAFVDAQLGRLLEALDRRFPREGTLIVVTSDHGESLGEHGEPTHSYSIYEATQRVPLIWSGPGFEKPAVVGDVVRLADLAPTLAAVVGAEPFPKADGRDLREAIGSSDVRAYSETLATHLDYGWSALFAVRDARWRYIAAPEPELFDLAADPRELRNVLSEHPEVASERAGWLAARREQETAAAPAQVLSADERARLAALGYVAGTTQTGDLSGPDPKRRLAVLDAINHAERLGSLGRWDEAHALLAASEETGATFRGIRASFAIRGGLYAEAERDAEAGLAEAPDASSLLHAAAFVREQRRDWSGARAFYQRALAADPTDAPALNGLGRVAEGQGDLAGAEQQYRAALAVQPGGAEAVWRLAGLRIQQGDLPAATAMLAEADAPLDVVVALRVTALEAEAGAAESAARRLEAILADRDLPPALTPAAVAIFEAGGRIPAATRVSELALRADPKSWQNQNGVAWGLALEGRDLDRALALAEEAVDGSKREPGVLDTLATVYVARGENEQALATVASALPRAAPEIRSHLYYAKARALVALGRSGEAREAVRRSLAEAPSPAVPWRAAAESLAREIEADTSTAPSPP